MKYILQSNIDDCSKLLSVIKYLGLATPLLTKPLKSFIELGNLTKMRVEGADANWEALKINGFKSQIWVGGVVKNPNF